MVTYYAAQLGIALSVVDSKASYNKAQANALAGKESASSTSSHMGNRIRRAIPLQ
jgi:hypothetical protein